MMPTGRAGLAAVAVLLFGCLTAAAGDPSSPPRSAPAGSIGPPATLQVGSPVRTILNLSYKSGSNACRLDLALPGRLDLPLPGKRPGPSPVIVVIHGGGWLEGDKSSFASDKFGVPGNIVDFARLGFAAATINYRMSREAPYPAALDDCRAAIRWLRAHASEYQFDAGRIGAYGNSAGGHLALLLALADDPADRGKAIDQSSHVQAAASDSGPVDLVADYRRGTLQSVIGRFMGGPPEGDRAAEFERASPNHYVSAHGPPLLFIYGEADTQVGVETADRFVTALADAGRKDVTYLRLAHVGHCPHSLQRVPIAKEAVDQFFVRTLEPH
jgi:acetyl esterase/lipase